MGSFCRSSPICNRSTSPICSRSTSPIRSSSNDGHCHLCGSKCFPIGPICSSSHDADGGCWRLWRTSRLRGHDPAVSLEPKACNDLSLPECGYAQAVTGKVLLQLSLGGFFDGCLGYPWQAFLPSTLLDEHFQLKGFGYKVHPWAKRA